MKRITLLLTALLTLIAVAQKNSFRMDVFLNDGTKRSYDLSSVKYVIIQEIGDKIAPNGDTIRMVDLNLPSGTLWADRNIGANCPAAAGNYYAWGETKTKNDYSSKKYTFTTIYWNISGTPYDAATMNWGGGCKMPDSAQIEELCDTKYTIHKKDSLRDKNGKQIKGYRIISKTNGNSIFLPANGCIKTNNVIHFPEYSGSYWSASKGGRGIYTGTESDAISLWTNNSNPYRYFESHHVGQAIRPVSKK